MHKGHRVGFWTGRIALGVTAWLVWPAVARSQPAVLPAPIQAWTQQCQQEQAAGQYTAALPFCEKAVAALEETQSADASLAAAQNDLGQVYYGLSRYTAAEPVLLRSLRLREKVLGPDHLEVAVGLDSLVSVYIAQARTAELEPLLLRSLRIREKQLGLVHPKLVASLKLLGWFYLSQGEYAKAEPLLLRGLSILENAPEKDLKNTAALLSDLGALYFAQNQYKKAAPLLLRGLAAGEKVHGPEHPYLATLANNVAMAYHFQDEFAKAEPLYLRSLQIRQKVLGPEHPDVAYSLHGLAGLYGAQGRYLQAEPLLLHSLRIREKVLGPEHPLVAGTLDTLAGLDMAQGQTLRALPRLSRILAIRENILRGAVTESRITSLLNTMRAQEERTYNLLLLPAPTVAAKRLALTTVLLRKGRAAEAGLMTGRALLNSLTTEEQRQRFEKWQALRGEHETLLLRGRGDQGLTAYQATLGGLRARLDALEQELARAAPALSLQRLPDPDALIPQVAARLGPSGALFEVVQVRPYKFNAEGTEQRWGEARYVALLLFSDQRIEIAELGLAASIDRAVAAFLGAVRSPSQNPEPPARSLYQLIFAPLVASLNQATRLFLSLDGSLNLIPLAALHDGKRYLIDAPYRMQYLTSGRDLLRGSLGRPAQAPLVLADPDFGQVIAKTSEAARKLDADTRSLYNGLGVLPRLFGTRKEGVALAQLLHVQPLLDGAATEAVVRHARAPAILHIATHGLSLVDVAAPGGVAARRLEALGTAAADAAQPEASGSGNLSLSSSALVLAGAAHAADAPNASEDGLLTAEEARGLNLFGTELVVLSACDTGRGAVKAGQGVYGLRRAFYVAGAETVVMSLWPVSDAETQGLMQRYYRLLLDRKARRGRVAGLWEAMRAVKAVHPHPYYWAPFIAVGRDAPLTVDAVR